MRVSRFPDDSAPTRRATNGTSLAARQATQYVQINYQTNGNIYVVRTWVGRRTPPQLIGARVG
jgi:hypothetical protein